MKRGIVTFSAAEIQVMQTVLANSSSPAATTLHSRLGLVSGQEANIQVSGDEIEAVLDQLPPPSPDPASQMANELRQKLTNFLQS